MDLSFEAVSDRTYRDPAATGTRRKSAAGFSDPAATGTRCKSAAGVGDPLSISLL